MTSCTSTLWDLIPNTDCRHQAYSITGCAQALTYMYTSTVHIHTCTHTHKTLPHPQSPVTLVPRPHSPAHIVQICCHASSQTTSLAHLALQTPPVLFLVCLAPYLQLMGQSGSLTAVMGQLCSAAIKLELERGHLCLEPQSLILLLLF